MLEMCVGGQLRAWLLFPIGTTIQIMLRFLFSWGDHLASTDQCPIFSFIHTAKYCSFHTVRFLREIKLFFLEMAL